MNFADVFRTPEHQPFLWEGSQAGAVLVHGFPGTPAEMRPLAATLHAAGWTVHGLLLPGFGAEIEALGQKRCAEWVEAVSGAVAAMQRRHRPTLLIGFSMGSAVSTAAAAQQPPDGLVLLAPFWKLTGPLWSILPLMQRIFPTIQPFRLMKPDFDNPAVRKGIANFMPGANLDDPAVRAALTNLKVPMRILTEVRRAGQAAGEAARRVRVPTLVLQGTQDPVVRPRWTHELAQRLPGPLRYHELDAAHDLLDPTKPAWSHITQAVLRFGAQLEHMTPF
jgi:carboxylesterase